MTAFSPPQLRPPVWLTAKTFTLWLFEPTATHSVVLGQLTERRVPVPLASGVTSIGVDQLRPPVVERVATGRFVAVEPTATQTLALAQETES